MRRWIAPAVVIGLLAVAPAAQANFHLMKISEVHPRSSVGAADAFVELQMYAAGQNFVNGKRISYYAASGSNNPVTTFSADVAEGGSQRTILIGDTAVAGRDFTDASLGLNIDPVGGAVCFDEPETDTDVDCVAWGSFTNTAGLAVGTPAPAIGAGQSLTRSTAPGCPTLLEASDDTNDSATDFTLAAPSPRPNAVAPAEQACVPGGGGSGAPNTEITKAPKKKTEKEKAKFKFTSSEQGSTFECKLDRRKFKPCDSPRKYRNLDEGKHKFKVRATDADGNADPTPAKHKWKVLG